MLPTHTQPPRRRLHTVEDVCAVVHLSRATVWRLIKNDALKTVPIGRRTLVTDESLQQLIEQGAPKTAPRGGAA
jgi:excisionase family DNA binding protein